MASGPAKKKSSFKSVLLCRGWLPRQWKLNCVSFVGCNYLKQIHSTKFRQQVATIPLSGSKDARGVMLNALQPPRGYSKNKLAVKLLTTSRRNPSVVNLTTCTKTLVPGKGSRSCTFSACAAESLLGCCWLQPANQDMHWSPNQTRHRT